MRISEWNVLWEVFNTSETKQEKGVILTRAAECLRRIRLANAAQRRVCLSRAIREFFAALPWLTRFTWPIRFDLILRIPPYSSFALLSLGIIIGTEDEWTGCSGAPCPAWQPAAAEKLAARPWGHDRGSRVETLRQQFCLGAGSNLCQFQKASSRRESEGQRGRKGGVRGGRHGKGGVWIETASSDVHFIFLSSQR